LEVGDWRCANIPVLRGVSFSVAPGEIFGVFGMIGSGIETVARGLGGDEPRIRGELRIAGASSKPFRGARDARRAGIGYVPAERKSEGLALARPIRDNLTVQVLHEADRLGFVRRRSETAVARQLISDFAINCRSLDQLTGELSGGNQQKVLLASRVAAAPRVLVLHEPTRGVDVGARAQIHDILAGLASRGAAVVVVTSDLAEAVELCDRLVVLREGRIVGRFSGEAKTRPNVLSAATHADESPLHNEEVER
jgi:ABC-type sugar transport system ATPase subunit